MSHKFLDMWVHEFSAYTLSPFFVFYNGSPFWVRNYEIVAYLCVVLVSLYTIYLWIKHMPGKRKKA